MFLSGVIIGGFTGFFIAFWLGVEAVSEKQQQIKYLRYQLASQAEAELQKAKQREVFYCDTI